jgi:phosphoribosyl-AMP cyclohydrolase
MSDTSETAKKHHVEEGDEFAPRFDAAGLLTAIVTDAKDGALLMVAHMNAEALRLTLETGIVHYWSRSRQAMWKKGETSGNFQKVEEMRVDCDQDAVWIKVMVSGQNVTCHTGRRSCFYRTVLMQNGSALLKKDENSARFEPSPVYP